MPSTAFGAAALSADAMLDFRVALTLDDETITPAEWRRILAGTDSLVLLKGKWVEVDREQLQQVLDQSVPVEVMPACR